MPAEGLPWLSKAARLSDDEFVRLAELFIRLGVRSIRLTGGEPLVHPTLPGVIARLTALEPRPEISLTTNGVTLARSAHTLAAAGLDRINISVDTLDRERFRELTRRDRLSDVLSGVAAASAAGLAPVKINTVLVRDNNLQEAPQLLGWALRSGYRLRFIEHMPLDADHQWSRNAMVTADEILDLLTAAGYALAPHGARTHAPAEEFDVVDGPDRAEWASEVGRVGVIASVTRPFCRECDRLGLTADGQLRTCLFAREETDLRAPLRDGATDRELAAIIVAAVAEKQAGHGIGTAAFVQPDRTMSAIGGGPQSVPLGGRSRPRAPSLPTLSGQLRTEWPDRSGHS